LRGDSPQNCRLCALLFVYSAHVDAPDFMSKPIAPVAKAQLFADGTKKPDFTALV